MHKGARAQSPSKTIFTETFFTFYEIKSSLTCFQFLLLPCGSLLHLLTSKTQALQISPSRFSVKTKHPLKCSSYLFEEVNLELEDFAPQIQQPSLER